MKLTGLGFGGLGVDDQSILQPGTIVTFEIRGIACPIGFAPDSQSIATAINNWASQMITINAIERNALGYVPGQFDWQVNATVKQAMPAGDLRGQIIAAVSAFGRASSCNDVQLVDSALNVAGGGTNPIAPNTLGAPPNPPGTCGILDYLAGNCGSGPGIGTTIIIAVVGLVAVAFLTRK